MPKGGSRCAMAVDPVAARRRVAAVVFVAVAILLICPLIGGSGLDYERVWSRQAPDWGIFWNLRLPRVLLAMLAGAALSGSGALYQALMRESLASPSSLGISSLAALGAVLAIAFHPGEDTRYPLVWLAAFAGATAGVLLIAALSRASRFSPYMLLLTGIALNGIAMSVTLLLHSLAGITKSFQITHWLMGGIAAVDYSALGGLAMIVVPGSIWLLRQARRLNVISYGEEWAAGRGVDVRRLSWQGFAIGAALAGAVTSITGPIAFVGLMVPHLLRRVVGPDYRVLLPASLMGGGAFLVLCDTVARSVLAPVEIPVGVATALLGGPFFVWLLWRRG